MCDLSNKLPVITMVVLHLGCKSKTLTKKGISIPNQDASSYRKRFMLSIVGSLFAITGFH